LLAFIGLNATSVAGQDTGGTPGLAVIQSPVGGALTFDGVDDHVAVSIPRGTTWSAPDVEARIRIDEFVPGEYQTVASLHQVFLLRVEPDGTVFGRFYYYDSPYGITDGYHNPVQLDIRSQPGAIRAGKWHHIALRNGHCDDDDFAGNSARMPGGACMQLYIDGTYWDPAYSFGEELMEECSKGKQGFEHGMSWSRASQSDLTIGGYDPTGSGMVNFFKGQIDEVRIWTNLDGNNFYPASAPILGGDGGGGTVPDRANIALAGDEPDLLRLWHMDEADDVPPGITLNGDTVMTLNLDESYVELGATAVDPAINMVVVESSPVGDNGTYHGGGTSVPVNIGGDVGTDPGEYTITYTATDASGNTATATRTVYNGVADLATGHYMLQEVYGQYTALSGNGTLVANDPNQGRFLLFNKGNGQYAIQGPNDYWVSSEGGYLISNALNPDDPEKQVFDIFDLGDGYFALKTDAGWAYADNADGGVFKTGSPQINLACKFRIVPPATNLATGHYTLQEVYGKWTSLGGNGTLVANDWNQGRFLLDSRGNGQYAILGPNGLWVSSEGGYLIANAPNADNPGQVFEIVNPPRAGSGSYPLAAYPQTCFSEWWNLTTLIRVLVTSQVRAMSICFFTQVMSKGTTQD